MIEASFERSGDPRAAATERVVSASDEIVMTWYDFNDPFVLTMAPGTANRPIGVFSTFFPARAAQVTLNGQVAAGSVWPETRGTGSRRARASPGRRPGSSLRRTRPAPRPGLGGGAAGGRGR